MGLILIIPVLAAAFWIISSSVRAVFRNELAPAWRGRFSLLVGIGLAFGFWLAFIYHKEVPEKIRFSGFPIPTAAEIFVKETKEWKNATPPEWVQIMGKISNLIAGVAIALIPVKVASFLRSFKEASSEPKP